MKTFNKSVGYLLIILVFVGSFYAVSRTQDIIDWWKLRSYVPSSSIESLADNTSMNPLGRRLFYVHDPELLEKSDFRSYCQFDEVTIVLGCYISRNRIFLYDVKEERLDGVEEVTAAHEMLHAAYDRLSSKEQERINEMLYSAYDQITDERIRLNIANYQARDKSVVPNELHSILGTEVRNLPRDLEVYYSLYFDHREMVVTLAENYAEAFTMREEQIAIYDKQLAELNGDISRIQADLTLQSQALLEERTLINSFRDNPEIYNNAVSEYNKKVNLYNTQIEKVKLHITNFNEIVSKRNAIAVEERELVDAIDTRQTEL